jgi:predicted O-methyltransferase YrrM
MKGPNGSTRLRMLVEACGELHENWCNPWACTASTLVALAMLAPGKRRILECGSGISTLVLAAAMDEGATLHVLEDQATWADQVRAALVSHGMGYLVRIHVSEPSEETGWWYDAPADLPDFDLVFVDGPAFHLADGAVNTDSRRGLYSKLARNIEGAVLVVDDAPEFPDVLADYVHSVADDRVAFCLPKQKRQAA